MDKDFERNWYLNFESRSHNPFKCLFSTSLFRKEHLPGYKGLVFVYSKRLWRWQKVIIKTNNHLTLSIWRLRRHFRFCKGSMDGGLTWETIITQQRREDLRKQITKQTENNKTTHYSTWIYSNHLFFVGWSSTLKSSKKNWVTGQSSEGPSCLFDELISAGVDTITHTIYGTGIFIYLYWVDVHGKCR